MMAKSKKGVHSAWFVLLGVAIMMGFARGGLNNATGLFLTPVSDDLGMSLSSLSLYVSIMSIVTMIFLPFAGKLIAKADIRIILIVGVIFHAGAFALMGFMNSVWGWYLLAVPCAIGYVIVAQISGPVIINNWFKKSKGLALGIMMATVGAFGAFISPWIGNLIANEGWRTAYTTSGLVLGAGCIVVILLFIAHRSFNGVFFVQSRVGYREKTFKILKFKTMSDRRDEAGILLPDAERLTPIGKIVRELSIDELPQLINVLKGDMALIGPRPLLPKYLPLYSVEQLRRHEVRPGIVGWAGVNGRNNNTWLKKFEMDVWYVDHVSFMLDLKIFFLAIKTVFVREGISKEGEATTVPFDGTN